MMGTPGALRPSVWVCPQERGLLTPAQPAGPGLCLLRFLVSEQASLLLFSDGTVQVSQGPLKQACF